MGLFQLGEFKLHSGQVSQWKIECDALTDEDIQALAVMGRGVLGSRTFGMVVGIPRGGLRIAEAMRPFVTVGAPSALIVDDVLTTGASMWAKREELNAQGIGVWGLVIFARRNLQQSWIKPIFSMG